MSISHKINYRWVRTSYENYIDNNDVTDHSDTDCDDDDYDDNAGDDIKDDKIYDIIYQLDAIECLFVFFLLNCIKLVNYFIFQTKMQGKNTQR